MKKRLEVRVNDELFKKIESKVENTGLSRNSILIIVLNKYFNIEEELMNKQNDCGSIINSVLKDQLENCDD